MAAPTGSGEYRGCGRSVSASSPGATTATLFNDSVRDAVTSAVARLRPMNSEVGSQAVGPVTGRHLLTTYVRCTHDRILELVAAASLDSVEDVVELPTGHCRPKVAGPTCSPTSCSSEHDGRTLGGASTPVDMLQAG